MRLNKAAAAIAAAGIALGGIVGCTSTPEPADATAAAPAPTTQATEPKKLDPTAGGMAPFGRPVKLDGVTLTMTPRYLESGVSVDVTAVNNTKRVLTSVGIEVYNNGKGIDMPADPGYDIAVPPGQTFEYSFDVPMKPGQTAALAVLTYVSFDGDGFYEDSVYFG